MCMYVCIHHTSAVQVTIWRSFFFESSLLIFFFFFFLVSSIFSSALSLCKFSVFFDAPLPFYKNPSPPIAPTKTFSQERKINKKEKKTKPNERQTLKRNSLKDSLLYLLYLLFSTVNLCLNSFDAKCFTEMELLHNDNGFFLYIRKHKYQDIVWKIYIF